MPRAVTVGLHAAIVAVTEEQPRVLTVPAREREARTAALPFGPLEPHHRTLELGLRAWVREQTGMDLAYVEQLYTFGDRDRALTARGGGRLISVAYLALVRERHVEGHGATWHGIYGLLPWEDRRSGEPAVLRDRIRPALDAWVDDAPDEVVRHERRGRVDITFGSGAAGWDNERVLDRYELLYEVGLVRESERDRDTTVQTSAPDPLQDPSGSGAELALDHRRILATALGRLRGKLKYRPLVFELVPETFTLLQLQRTVESLVGVGLHKQNFRRLVERGALVEGTGRLEPDTGGRPAELFRFRREVLHERPAPGVGLPALPPTR